MVIKNNSDHIRIDGYRGSWYVIDTMKLYSFDRSIAFPVFLLESEQYGDEWPGLIVSKFGDVLMDGVYNGFEDLEGLEEW